MCVSECCYDRERAKERPVPRQGERGRKFGSLPRRVLKTGRVVLNYYFQGTTWKNLKLATSKGTRGEVFSRKEERNSRPTRNQSASVVPVTTCAGVTKSSAREEREDREGTWY